MKTSLHDPSLREAVSEAVDSNAIRSRTLTPDDYPALFRSADESSVAAQSSYLWLIRIQYGLLVTAAAVALWFDYAPVLLLVYAFVVGASTALLIYMSVKTPEKDWYGCRALAESIKTSTWRYIMRAEPFEDAPQVARRRFTRDKCVSATHNDRWHMRSRESQNEGNCDNTSHNRNDCGTLVLWYLKFQRE